MHKNEKKKRLKNVKKMERIEFYSTEYKFDKFFK